MIQCAKPSEQFKSYQDEIESAVLKVMRSDRFILGENVAQLENEFASYIGVKYAIGVANGTDALELSLKALGIQRGDEVITVSHTAVATIAAIENIGAVPVLVDIDPLYYTLDPKKLLDALTKKTKVVIAVHIYGQAADLNEIVKFCKKFDVFLIEDTSQAHGAKYFGQRLGSIGTLGCFSCYPTKNLGAIGDAGLITTNSNRLYQKIKKLREYGWTKRNSAFPGRNSRLDEIQASVLRIKLRNLDQDNAKRQELAAYYSKHLIGLPLKLPTIRDKSIPVFHLFVVQLQNRNHIIQFLAKNDIFVGIHYPIPVHKQKAYKNRLTVVGGLKITENLSRQIVSLPIYPELSILDAKKVVECIKLFYAMTTKKDLLVGNNSNIN